MKLRDYEQEWVSRIVKSRSKRVLLVGPTGSGKTVVAAHLIREAIQRHGKVLFLAHRAELIAQAKLRLVDHGVPNKAIGTIMANEQENRLASIQVASVQTLVRRELPEASIVFVDEAHHAAASTYRKILDHYSGALVFGLTATPYRLDGKPLGDLFEEIIESASASKLIDEGWLSRPRVFTVPVNERPELSGVKITAGDFNLGQLEAATKKKHLVGSIVDHWKRLAEGRPTVCYSVSVKHGEKIRDAFKAAGVRAELLTGETKKRVRQAMLARLATGETSVVVNCMVLTEGWDCPEARCAIVARPTMSQTLWLQMAGRIMRKGDVAPLILDHAGNALVHPIPGTDIEHSLTTEQKKARKHGTSKEKVCGNCGSSVSLGQRVCPSCGFEFWSGEPPEEIQAELREVVDSRRFQCIGCGKRLYSRNSSRPVRCRSCRESYLRSLIPRCTTCGKQRSSKQNVAAGGFVCKSCRSETSIMPQKACKDCGKPLPYQSAYRGCVRCGKCAIIARAVVYSSDECSACGRRLSVSQRGKSRCSVCRRSGKVSYENHHRNRLPQSPDAPTKSKASVQADAGSQGQDGEAFYAVAAVL